MEAEAMTEVKAVKAVAHDRRRLHKAHVIAAKRALHMAWMDHLERINAPGSTTHSRYNALVQTCQAHERTLLAWRSVWWSPDEQQAALAHAPSYARSQHRLACARLEEERAFLSAGQADPFYREKKAACERRAAWLERHLAHYSKDAEWPADEPCHLAAIAAVGPDGVAALAALKAANAESRAASSTRTQSHQGFAHWIVNVPTHERDEVCRLFAPYRLSDASRCIDRAISDLTEASRAPRGP
jgi:hypothetical protein